MASGPKGFVFNAVRAGLKKEGYDFALIFSEQEASCAGVFTTNLVKAAPVLLGQERIKEGKAQAILVNSGCANACTGDLGLEDARILSQRAADLLQIKTSRILPASTGVIGERLPLNQMERILPDLVQGLSPEKAPLVAQAMMTTDTFPKLVKRNLSDGENEITILGLAKGAGMIAPHMATMLAFIITDASLSSRELENILQKATEVSFNRITVDGDTSTNDTVYALANGKIGLNEGQKKKFEEAFIDICQELAYLIVKDGEGATKTVWIKVKGALDNEAAIRLARCISNSLLVKTALFGEDPNWGRIMAAMGRSGVKFDPYQVDIYIDDVQIVKNGLSLGKEKEREAHQKMKKQEFNLIIDLKIGTGKGEILTCDLSYDYVKINAEYRT